MGGSEMICYLLNSLSEENEQLKELLSTYEDMHSIKMIQKLQKENEQLKQQLEDCEIKKQNHIDMLMNSKPVTEQKKLQKIIYDMVIAMIDEKMEQCVLFNDTKCAVVLSDLKKELKGDV